MTPDIDTGAPGTWLTDPDIIEGWPNDSLAVPVKPQIFIDHFGTEPAREPGGGLSLHSFQASYVVYIVASTVRAVNNAKADTLRAIFAGEGAITTAVGMPAFPGAYQRKLDMERAGYFVALQVFHIDFNIDHASP